MRTHSTFQGNICYVMYDNFYSKRTSKICNADSRRVGDIFQNVCSVEEMENVCNVDITEIAFALE